MDGRPTKTEGTVQAFECARCGERLDGASDSCSDPLCDGEPRSIGVARE
jgi:hypothetical protein